MISGAEFTEHRNKVVSIFHSYGISEGTIVYHSSSCPQEPFSGSKLPFYPEALFFWLTGWTYPDSAILIDLQTGSSHLFFPPFDQDYLIWTGPAPSDQDIVNETGINELHPIKELESFIQSVSLLFITENQISLFKEYHACNTFLTASCIAYRIKSQKEIQVL
jgi:hypothetical protein